jgi:hypothetical protein
VTVKEDLYTSGDDITISTRLTRNVRVSRFLKFAGGTSYLRTIGLEKRIALGINLAKHAELIEHWRKNDRLVFHRVEVIEGVYPNAKSDGSKISYAFIDPFGGSSVELATYIKESLEEQYTVEIKNDFYSGSKMVVIVVEVQ